MVRETDSDSTSSSSQGLLDNAISSDDLKKESLLLDVNSGDNDEVDEIIDDTKISWCSLSVILLLSNAFVMGMLVSFVECYLFLYISDEYDASNAFLGACVLIMTLSEIPVFQRSNRIIEKIGTRCVTK